MRKKPFSGVSREQRYWAKIDKRGPDDCWPWLAALTDNGYASFLGCVASRFGYELEYGPIPAGMIIDHTCHTAAKHCYEGVKCPHRHCQNPRHFELVTRKENSQRGHFVRSLRTHCPQGHPYDEANTIVHNGKRSCKECGRFYSRAYATRIRKAASEAGLKIRDYLALHRQHH